MSTSPAAGRVLAAGAVVAGGAPEKVARRGLRLVPEGRQIFEPLTVEENLRIGATAGGAALRDGLEHAYDRFPILGGATCAVARGRCPVASSSSWRSHAH